MVLAKLTRKNQLTLPKAVLEQAGPADTYDVVCENGVFVLTPCGVRAEPLACLRS